MKVLITGAGGQLGTELAIYLKRKLAQAAIFPLARQDLDITNFEQVQGVIRGIRPDVIIHTAAYTKVDQAETDQDLAYAINAIGTRNVATCGENVGAKLVYISTDYVFDGRKNAPYTESDQPNPLNIYGRTKLAGEEFVRSLSSRHFIVRTSWVYGKHGQNFVTTMLQLAEERQELMVVDDQVGSPTYTLDLAEFIVSLMKTEQYGLYHATNLGACSWYELAGEIFRLKGMKVKLRPCRSEDFARPARRPAYSVLEHTEIRNRGFKDLRPWQEGLAGFLRH